MREGWEIRSLVEMGHASLGKMLDKNKNRGVLKRYLRNLNVRWFNFDKSDMLEMRFEEGERERYTARKGDLLVCEGGYPGRAAIWSDEEPVYFQKAIHRVRFNEPERAKWVLYYLHLCDIDGSLPSHFTGSGIQHFTGEALKRFRVPFPPLAEQRRVVAILDEAFAGLAIATANAERNLENARELNQSLASSILTPHADWVTSTLAQIVAADCTLSYGIVQPGEDFPGGLPIVRPVDLTRPVVDRNGLKLIDPALAKSYDRTRLKGGELLLCVRGSTGTISIAPHELLGANVTRGIVPIRFDERLVDTQFGYHLMKAPGIQNQIREKTYGTALMQINIADLRKVRVSLPPVWKQRELGQRLEAVANDTATLDTAYASRISEIQALKQSILHKAFSGGLSAKATTPVVPFPSRTSTDPNLDTAMVLALAYQRHKFHRRERTFAHTKQQKILHLVEAGADHPLGRQAIRDAAGPNDFLHMRAAEGWAEANQYFRVSRLEAGNYQFQPMAKFEKLLNLASSIEPTIRKKIEQVIDLFVPMSTRQAEVFATIYAAWNNLLLEGKTPTDEEIVRAAREDWHIKKLEIPRPVFFEGLQQVRQSAYNPKGTGRYVPPPAQAQLPL
ncbi:restriction endonuclease subunit S [Mesorhizobium sp. CO1-1-4]|uniref:restriction endonuclease subunit S n=1 Tax=Mesorhizobium sp. CO1-1-4 TaxID=2876633 RepID=UPI001CCBCE14|nr:restriction endonuclease subunit S [Mesorhizobium sp. CO1-1-4]MBZ9738229.1 restriction endonuclease subunit S [Mesorhizobium sp. CO1-1-4]